MKRVVVLVILAAILSGFLLSGIPDASALIADTNIPDSETTTPVHKPINTNSSATTTITITMYALPHE